jgi:hypothetical protein
MKELDVVRAVMARADNYAITSIKPTYGRFWSVIMNNEQYNAVVLVHSFEYYERRYHVAKTMKPTLILCFVHDTVVPVPVLSMRAGNFAKAYELPTEIEDIETQRWSKTGAQVLLGMYISGVRLAQTIVKELPPSTRNRYLQRVEDLSKRKRGRPVGLEKQEGK